MFYHSIIIFYLFFFSILKVKKKKKKTMGGSGGGSFGGGGDYGYYDNTSYGSDGETSGASVYASCVGTLLTLSTIGLIIACCIAPFGGADRKAQLYSGEQCLRVLEKTPYEGRCRAVFEPERVSAFQVPANTTLRLAGGLRPSVYSGSRALSSGTYVYESFFANTNSTVNLTVVAEGGNVTVALLDNRADFERLEDERNYTAAARWEGTAFVDHAFVVDTEREYFVVVMNLKSRLRKVRASYMVEVCRSHYDTGAPGLRALADGAWFDCVANDTILFDFPYVDIYDKSLAKTTLYLNERLAPYIVAIACFAAAVFLLAVALVLPFLVKCLCPDVLYSSPLYSSLLSSD